MPLRTMTLRTYENTPILPDPTEEVTEALHCYLKTLPNHTLYTADEVHIEYLSQYPGLGEVVGRVAKMDEHGQPTRLASGNLWVRTRVISITATSGGFDVSFWSTGSSTMIPRGNLYDITVNGVSVLNPVQFDGYHGVQTETCLSAVTLGDEPAGRCEVSDAEALVEIRRPQVGDLLHRPTTDVVEHLEFLGTAYNLTPEGAEALFGGLGSSPLPAPKWGVVVHVYGGKRRFYTILYNTGDGAFKLLTMCDRRAS